ncbi:MAG TPA: Rieske 2Fe-2S domain-containing protein [Noviherbaspirillum sp.]|uniref:Rieske (2Fe-2S) protein n=1 Tax=Noviherbaspirillum sp. TaxID=1926288 RepID=UPI002B4A0E26|nr:Rieske 2Fe-2S domain-containing protein [Noviherbaspirillum sp.]HJV87019.1 Rieske 2Fe-2S domain-containing protein [Noviherbaspirillum sp.]
MDDLAILICASSDLVEGGKGVRFPLTAGGEDGTGFAVRYQNTVYAYLNRCAHVPIELDWNEGEFFESSGLYLMCSTHGAIYVPESGRCAGGPCRGGRLRQITVFEKDGQVFWHPDDYIKPARA